MTERSTARERSQFGVETTPGTGVAANKRFTSIDVNPQPALSIQSVKAQGAKFATAAVPGKEFAKAPLTGIASYDELAYLLAGIVSPTSAQVAATSAYTHTYSPDTYNADAKKTFTVETGQTSRAQKITYGMISDLMLEFSREGAKVDGAMIGQAIEDDITMTASPTDIGLVPIMPDQLDVFLDPSYAAIGSSQLLRVPSIKWGLKGVSAPIWALNNAESSFVSDVEDDVVGTIDILMEADAAGMAELVAARDGDKRFIQIHAAGVADSIESGQDYDLNIDVCGVITNVAGYEDDEGLYCVRYTLDIAHDETWGQAWEAIVKNKITAIS